MQNTVVLKFPSSWCFDFFQNLILRICKVRFSQQQIFGHFLDCEVGFCYTSASGFWLLYTQKRKPCLCHAAATWVGCKLVAMYAWARGLQGEKRQLWWQSAGPYFSGEITFFWSCGLGMCLRESSGWSLCLGCLDWNSNARFPKILETFNSNMK